MYREKRREQLLQAVEMSKNARFEDFGNQIKESRLILGLTQEQVGKTVGVTGTQVRLWEKGRTVPRPNNLERLCGVLGLPIPLSVMRSKDGHFPIRVGTCIQCGRPFPVYKEGVEHCGRKCAGLTQSQRQKGENNPVWKGGQYHLASGYIRVKVDQKHQMYSMTDCNGYVLEHRLVMAEHLGRPLKSHEHVHHRNGVRDDNRIENLELWTVGRKDPSGQRSLDRVKDVIGRLSLESQADLVIWLQKKLGSV